MKQIKRSIRDLISDGNEFHSSAVLIKYDFKLIIFINQVIIIRVIVSRSVSWLKNIQQFSYIHGYEADFGLEKILNLNS